MFQKHVGLDHTCVELADAVTSCLQSGTISRDAVVHHGPGSALQVIGIGEVVIIFAGDPQIEYDDFLTWHWQAEVRVQLGRLERKKMIHQQHISVI